MMMSCCMNSTTGVNIKNLSRNSYSSLPFITGTLKLLFYRKRQALEAKQIIHRIIIDDLTNDWLKFLDSGTTQQFKVKYHL